MTRTPLLGAMMIVLVLGSVCASRSAAQAVPAWGETSVNSELERYLRVLQVAGLAERYPWSIRAFSPDEIRRIASKEEAAHPWEDRFDLRMEGEGAWISGVRPGAGVVYNTMYPYGRNDGAVWAGRGATVVAQAGIAGEAGPVSFSLVPMGFWAQNGDFPLAPTGRVGELAFADALNPTSIDQPQRFGDGSYGRLDPGQSSVRLDAYGVAVGVSTANQHWGPGHYFPLMLGNHAPGYLHGFVGTAHPVNLWIGHLHGRLVAGRLDQSDYTPWTGLEAKRFTSALVALFVPRGVEGLEIGASRFFHIPWRDEGPTSDDVLKPVEGLLKEGLRTDDNPDGSDPDNQLASVFARWVFPESGVEVYGEYAREDHNWDFRDLVLEPDHDSGYLLGLGKVWSTETHGLLALRAEVLNMRISHLARVRNQTVFYRHGRMRQGHTQRGQILASPAGYGGGAFALSLDRYHPEGRWGVRWIREVRGERRGLNEDSTEDHDVLHTLTLDALFHRGRMDVRGELTGNLNLNRNFGADVGNVRLGVDVRMRLW